MYIYVYARAGHQRRVPYGIYTLRWKILIRKIITSIGTQPPNYHYVQSSDWNNPHLHRIYLYNTYTLLLRIFDRFLLERGGPVAYQIWFVIIIIYPNKAPRLSRSTKLASLWSRPYCYSLLPVPCCEPLPAWMLKCLPYIFLGGGMVVVCVDVRICQF